MFRSALNYYAAVKSSTMSFVELFEDLAKYIDTEQSRWKFALRLKRGYADTGVPGGLYKDQCYLEGAVNFLQERKNIDIEGLFCGKISLEDLKKPKIQKIINKDKDTISFPPFCSDWDAYLKALDHIAETNLISTNPAEASDA